MDLYPLILESMDLQQAAEINSTRNVNLYYAKHDVCRANINDHDCWSRHMLFLLPVFWSDRIAIFKIRNASKFIVNV